MDLNPNVYCDTLEPVWDLHFENVEFLFEMISLLFELK